MIPAVLPLPGQVIEPRNAGAAITATSRVLYVDELTDRIVCIPVEPKQSKGRKYFTGPQIQKLSQLQKELDKNDLHLLRTGVAPRPDVAATANDLDKKYRRHGEPISKIRREREVRYEIIRPLVHDRDGHVLLFDPQVRHERILARANEIHDGKCSLERTAKRVTELINQYFAEGATEGAVTPFSGAKGGRGKERSQRRKIGRQNTPTAQGIPGVEGFVMSERDKEQCGFAWRNYYIRGNTIAKALRRLWREFYSTAETDERGKLKHKLLPAHQRPSRSQFITWGQKRSPGHESWKKQLTALNLNRIGRVTFGSVTDDVVSVGQRGSVDSTSVDLEFVSVAKRLDRIGPAHRILVVDSLYGYISGFYLGLDAPSSKTVRLAFLHSLTDKSDWLKWLGLEEQDVAHWIPIRYSTVLADNTDLRNDDTEQILESIGTGLKFVGVARSDLNAPVETSHHMLHRMVDHNLLGTTHGQRRERGDESPDILARHTIIEGQRETARAVYVHNTMELDIRPTLEMRRELLDKGIKLTRANLTRWAINRGRCSSSLISESEARTKLLLPTRGTFTADGVKLLRGDTGRKRTFIEPVFYQSRHPLIVQRCLEAKMKRQRVAPEFFDDDFRHDPYKPNDIYYRNNVSGELIRLSVVSDDKDLPSECSYPDFLDLMQRDALHLYNVRNAREETLSDMEAGQEATKRLAEDAYNEALAELPKPPSKRALRANKKENREQEKERFQYGIPIQPPTHASPPPRSEVAPANESEPPAKVPPAPPPISSVVTPPDSIPPPNPSEYGSALRAAMLIRRSKGDHIHVH